MVVLEELDAVVRRSDPDRWLASRFIADRAARTDVIVIYAFNDELARIAGAVSQPLLGEIRLAWWREALDEVFAGGTVRRHPVVEGLALVVRRRNLARTSLEAMIDARYVDLEADALAEGEARERYIDGTAGAVMALAIAILVGHDGLAARPAARAWALAGLWRVGRLPKAMDAARVRADVAETLVAANAMLATLPVAAFPAVAYATLARAYAAGRRPSGLEKRIRLLGAVLRGRV